MSPTQTREIENANVSQLLFFTLAFDEADSDRKIGVDLVEKERKGRHGQSLSHNDICGMFQSYWIY